MFFLNICILKGITINLRKQYTLTVNNTNFFLNITKHFNC